MRNAALLLLLGILSGCIKVDETLTVAADSAGMLEVMYGMPEQAVAQLELIQSASSETGVESPSPDVASDADTTAALLAIEFDPERLRQALEPYARYGVHLDSVATDTRAGWRSMRLRVRFDSLKALLGTELYRERNFSLTRTAEGNYLLTLARGGRPEPSADIPKRAVENGEASAGILAGFHVRTTITVPGAILDTNAHRRVDSTVIWEYDIDKDANALSRMGEERPYIVFDGTGLELPEIRPEQHGEKTHD